MNTKKTKKITAAKPNKAAKDAICINILVKGGILQEIKSNRDSGNLRVEVFDLDNNPELEQDYEEITRGQTEIAF